MENPIDDLKTLRTNLRPGGIITLAHQPGKSGATEKDADDAGDNFADYLKRAGFKDIAIEKKIIQPVSTACVLEKN